MKKPYTSVTRVGCGVSEDMKKYISENFIGERGVCICDENTRRFMPSIPSVSDFITYAGDVCAEDTIGDELCTAAREMNAAGRDIGFLVACGSGSVHDITRYAAYRLGLPFISFPTAASVDGFVSNVAAMTSGGRKETSPAQPPAALFADAEIYRAAPRRLTVSGAGDIIGKYISLCDWRISHLITGEEIDPEIMALTVGAVNEVMSLDPASDSFTDAVMDGLIKSGMAIQYHGSSRPASGAEHHLSHLWEMHCVNAPTDALHGEKVGVGALLVLERYREIAETDFAAR
ncbi:MAG: iron-containing alcohol dehydrogenase, partial [Eubacteriales bacterium]